MSIVLDGHSSHYGEVNASRKQEFLEAGIKGRHFFPHLFHHLPKCGPDGYKLAQRMCSETDPNTLSELVLYTTAEMAAAFPENLWFDRDLIWHEQQFGRTGQVASCNLRSEGTNLWSMVLISDLVQRISRRPIEKSRIENRFKGWPAMLLNAMLSVAASGGYRQLFVPKSTWAMQHTDPNRTVQADMFVRVYDRAASIYSPRAEGNWWVIDVKDSLDRLVLPEARIEPVPEQKIICICHDIERGLGHLDIDPEFAALAETSSRQDLLQMAQIEHSLGVNCTYSVVGTLMDDVAARVEALGHEVAFHSFNHVVSDEQLAACREVDYRIKGYRPPQSKITPELIDADLCFHNFEWLASSAYSLGFDLPMLENRLVKLPILFDDWAMYSRGQSYPDWKSDALEMISSAPFAAFGLHDCYARYWLHDYPDFLSEVQSMGQVLTLNQVAARTLFAHAFESFSYSQPGSMPKH